MVTGNQKPEKADSGDRSEWGSWPGRGEKGPDSALTSGHVHGVEAGQQVTAPLAIPLHLAQPVVAIEVISEVWPFHVGHYYSVQVPAGIQTRVVMLNPETKAQPHHWQKKHQAPPES